MEKKIVPTLVNFRESEIGAILVNHFGNKRKTRIAPILVGLLILGASPLFAAETVKKENTFKQVVSIEKRGAVNFFTSPGELAYSFIAEKKDHPKAWPATYIPRLFSNMAVRVGSSVHDIAVLPWYAAKNGDIPLTRRFELPDYVWEKE
jgi:hypothetical protein